MELIKCPICGEMYSATYPRCPFCEEDGDRPRKLEFKPRRRIADKNKAQSARGALILVLALVLGLLGWYLFGGNIARDGKTPDNTPEPQDQTEPSRPANNPNTSDDPFYEPQPTDPADGTGDAEPVDGGQDNEPQPTVEPDPEPQPADENVDVSNAKLNRSDFTLSGVGDSFRVKVSGTEATPHWSIDNANVASIRADGTVTAVANGNTTLRCRVGTRELTCIVRVNGTGKTAASADGPTAAEEPSNTSSGQNTATNTGGQNTSTSTGTQGNAAHVDASALSVKTNYGTTLQKDPDTGYPDCTVRIGGDPVSLKVVGTDVPVTSWTSDKPSVVTVDENGRLTPVSSGTAHVIIKIGDVEIICIIRVR